MQTLSFANHKLPVNFAAGKFVLLNLLKFLKLKCALQYKANSGEAGKI